MTLVDDTHAPEQVKPLKEQIERAITQTIAAWQEVGVAEGSNAGMTETRQRIAHAEVRSEHRWALLDRIPWGWRLMGNHG